jgi:hypothetical protein
MLPRRSDGLRQPRVRFFSNRTRIESKHLAIGARPAGGRRPIASSRTDVHVGDLAAQAFQFGSAP